MKMTSFKNGWFELNKEGKQASLCDRIAILKITHQAKQGDKCLELHLPDPLTRVDDVTIDDLILFQRASIPTTSEVQINMAKIKSEMYFYICGGGSGKSEQTYNTVVKY